MWTVADVIYNLMGDTGMSKCFALKHRSVNLTKAIDTKIYKRQTRHQYVNLYSTLTSKKEKFSYRELDKKGPGTRNYIECIQ